MGAFRSLALAGFAAVCFGAAGAHAQPYEGRDFDDQGSYQDQARGPNLDDLHDALKLTPAQDDAWRAFAAASGPDGDQLARARAAQEMLPALHAPQRVDLAIAAMEADLETLRRRGAAVRAFYAQLTGEQQQIFDRQTLPQRR